MPEPKYSKVPHEPSRDYRMMTWELFLTVREWAQEVANLEGYPVYLVGSCLRKIYPRDIDVSMIMPVSEFETRFGCIPDDDEELGKFLNGPVSHAKVPYLITLQERIRHIMRVDFKITPDTWHTHQDKMLLAEPDGKVFVRHWTMYQRAEKTGASE